MGRHTMGDLRQMQSLPLAAKIRMTEYRIHQWVGHYGEDRVYIGFSGGKDSTVLMDLARKLYPRLPAVYVDTGLEYPGVRQFVRQKEDVEILRPKMGFKQVIERYGYPFIGKEVAGCVYGARRYMEKLLEKEMGGDPPRRIPNYSYMADLVGIGRREDKGDDLYQRLIRGEIPSTEIKAPVRYLMLQGRYLHKEKGIVTSEYSRMYNKERYKFFLGAPFEISDRCCSVMKKAPMHSYAKRTGRMPMTAQMACESRLRATNWMKNGCNGFHMREPISNPMSFWTEQDVLGYIHSHDLPIADVYGKVQEQHGKCQISKGRPGEWVYRTTGCNRTGCIFCGFGCHLEESPNRWEIAEEVSDPALIDYMMRGGDFDVDGIWKPDKRGLGFWFVIEWINVHGGLHIVMPHRERYMEEYMTERTQGYLSI